MRPAGDPRLDRMLEAALNAREAAAPVAADLAPLVDLARSLEGLADLPPPAGLAERIAAALDAQPPVAVRQSSARQQPDLQPPAHAAAPGAPAGSAIEAAQAKWIAFFVVLAALAAWVLLRSEGDALPLPAAGTPSPWPAASATPSLALSPSAPTPDPRRSPTATRESTLPALTLAATRPARSLGSATVLPPATTAFGVVPEPTDRPARSTATPLSTSTVPPATPQPSESSTPTLSMPTSPSPKPTAEDTAEPTETPRDVMPTNTKEPRPPTKEATPEPRPTETSREPTREATPTPR